MSNFLYALAESISLSYLKKKSGLNRDKKKAKAREQVHVSAEL